MPFFFTLPFCALLDEFLRLPMFFGFFRGVHKIPRKTSHVEKKAEFWFLGVPQVAHSTRGVMTRFASGGAGYMISRALLPKLLETLR